MVQKRGFEVNKNMENWIKWKYNINNISAYSRKKLEKNRKQTSKQTKQENPKSQNRQKEKE